MLKGLAITPPVLGRISIGKIIEKNGKRLPEKDDQFTITSQVQGKDGWLLHPLNDELRKSHEDKLRSIPVRLLFNETELNFRADYTLFDRNLGDRCAWVMARPASASLKTACNHCHARRRMPAHWPRAVPANLMAG